MKKDLIYAGGVLLLGLGYAGLCAHISERPQEQAQRRETEQRFTHFVDMNNNKVVTPDEVRRAAAIFGYNHEISPRTEIRLDWSNWIYDARAHKRVQMDKAYTFEGENPETIHVPANAFLEYIKAQK